MIRDALRTYLRSVSGVTDLVGAGDAARIWPDSGRQDATLPFVVYHFAPGRSYSHLGGSVQVEETRIEIACYAETDTAADALQDAIDAALPQNFRGSWDTAEVLCIDIDQSPMTGDESKEPGSDEKRFWSQRDYIVTYRT